MALDNSTTVLDQNHSKLFLAFFLISSPQLPKNPQKVKH